MISRRRGPRILAALALTCLLFSALSAAPASASAVSSLVSPARSAETDAPVESDAPGDAIWSWPVQPRPEISRLFDLEHRYSAGHRGIDLAVPAGTAVYAPDDGTVHFVGWVVDRPLLSIQHANGIRSTFEPVDAAVAEGDAVTRGQLIGHVADSPAHEPSGGLHLGARLGDDYLDPLALLGEVPRAILLPISP
ncbi:M23 family metallopeptidase [Gulosibacter sediminis]|uniref:M23 family metallopeptidase n=1 Tax=Gulosibacter sediminis TaxID=1729695 RepID=UPI0024A90F86|nr:M23 family metallopeptidase [Gulosibacter sediminis]